MVNILLTFDELRCVWDSRQVLFVPVDVVKERLQVQRSLTTPVAQTAGPHAHPGKGGTGSAGEAVLGTMGLTWLPHMVETWSSGNSVNRAPGRVARRRGQAAFLGRLPQGCPIFGQSAFNSWQPALLVL